VIQKSIKENVIYLSTCAEATEGWSDCYSQLLKRIQAKNAWEMK